MPSKRLADTNALIKHFRELRPYDRKTTEQAEEWGRSYAREFNAVIVAPVEVEFLAGIVDRHEMTLAEAYLRPFSLADRREPVARDWEEARRVAKHVGFQAARRQLCDCLITALADRLHIDVIQSEDKGLHRQRGRTRQCRI